jgi:hypothetical protein
MASKTCSERVNIIKYVKAAKGWRFAPVVKRPKWDHVLIGGTAQAHPEGKYFIEWREDGVRRRRSVGSFRPTSSPTPSGNAHSLRRSQPYLNQVSSSRRVHYRSLRKNY